MEVEATQSEQDLKDKERRQRLQSVWKARLEKEETDHEDYRDRAREVETIFKSNLPEHDTLYVPLYWSVVNVQHVGVYSSQPVPDVRPRHEKNNPLFKQVATLIRRGLAVVADAKGFDDNFHRTVDDYLSVGMGVPRVKIDSIISMEQREEPEMEENPLGGEPIQVGTNHIEEEVIGDQTLRWEYTPWARVGWEPGNSWESCMWIYFRHRMTKRQVKTRFGRELSASKDDKVHVGSDSWMNETVDIYEVWDKTKRKVLFIAMGEDEPVEVIDDPLELTNFYPIPNIMMMNMPSEEMIPKADYDYIETFDVELNRLQQRRMGLTEQLKAVGAYDEGLPELGDIMELEDGQFKPIPQLGQRTKQGQGFEQVLHYMPIEEKARVLTVINEQIMFVKAQVDEILGISDIVRGVTKASETLGAQEIKGRWVGIRLTRKRDMVQYTIREMFRISAELLGTHITTENLSRMTQMEITPEMEQLLQDDVLMRFVIDIETESTVAKDEFRERETRQEMMAGMAQYAQAVMPLVQAGSMPAEISSAILKAAMAPYARYDRGLDEALDNLPDQQQQLQQLNQQMQELQGKLQQAEGESQQWEAIANKLQMTSTEATSTQKMADAAKKDAETREIEAGLGDDGLQVVKTIAEISEINARGKAHSQPQGSGGF